MQPIGLHRDTGKPQLAATMDPTLLACANVVLQAEHVGGELDEMIERLLDFMEAGSSEVVEHLDRALAELSIWWRHEVECDDAETLHVPASLLEEAGRVWARNNAPVDGYPEGKYPDVEVAGRKVPNFKAGIAVSRLIDSALRHVMRLAQGEHEDPESGLHHAGHAVCNLSMVAFMIQHRPAFDDRDLLRGVWPTPEPAPETSDEVDVESDVEFDRHSWRQRYERLTATTARLESAARERDELQRLLDGTKAQADRERTRAAEFLAEMNTAKQAHAQLVKLVSDLESKLLAATIRGDQLERSCNAANEETAAARNEARATLEAARGAARQLADENRRLIEERRLLLKVVDAARKIADGRRADQVDELPVMLDALREVEAFAGEPAA